MRFEMRTTDACFLPTALHIGQFCLVAVLSTSSALLIVRHASAAETVATVQPSAAAEIRSLIGRYVLSIDEANATLGASVWSPTGDVSFIEPRGHERGWDQIAAVFYGRLMGDSFTKRTLRIVGDVNVRLYGDAAIAEFDWDFVAVRRDNRLPVHTTGRESQVYANLPDKGWRLVEVHYSGPPTTEIGRGF
jgi:hypothetical protein